ncbi:hypothetical protein N7492_009047 [Penicillium capsulatum]|uniref:NmrA-like domain-containing protein n=1 Tax=Penicillium capsulatum TaxID=69766 RepID=A0A9W9HWG0_9EURO|nr:hypothetical protein N7492_009047 [Penicillium capsulatum]KAJ6106445.1 hypothetical protein N7512_009962 [Penicillium capsulatum]
MTASISKPTVAIAGATGHLGQHVASAFLSPPFRDQFSNIILLSRNKAALDTMSTYKGNFTARIYNENNLQDALQGVQILVNTVGPSGHTFKEKLARALPHTEVEVYFPSEFGVDHYVHDFPHLEWDQKKKHLTLAQAASDTKICRVFCGLFLDDSIGPWFGFDTKTGIYESVGSFDSPISFTSLDDVGRTVAALAALPRERVPETVHVGGDTRSIAEIAAIMQDAGAGEIKVTDVPLVKYKSDATATTSWDPARYLRFLMGENKICHMAGGLGNDNELVNEMQRGWEWKTVADLARETKGQPWKDFPWTAQ